MASTLSDATYKKLLADLRRLLKRARASKSEAQQLLAAYWGIGEKLDETQVLQNAAYGDAIYNRLSQDLQIDSRTLRRSVSFFSQYPELPETGLSWAHYRELIALSHPKERAFYEQLAVGEALSRDKLASAIASDLFHTKAKGKPGAQLPRPTDLRYLFQADLLRVIDGDTLFFRIDLGFEVIKEQRVRLSSVDTLSAGSQGGKRATQFVADNLCFADRIVLKTHRADLHGRYVAHVFYSTTGQTLLETFQRGHYLNQELLDQRLAMLAKR